MQQSSSDSINISGDAWIVVGDSAEGNNNSGNDTIIVEETGWVDDFLGGDSDEGNNNSGDDTIINNGFTDGISGDSYYGDNNSGDDTITNNGFTYYIMGDSSEGNGNSGDDTIVNNGEADYIYGDSDFHRNDSGNNTITNNEGGLVNEDIEGGGGNDDITNLGIVGDDIQGNDGDDTIINSGTVDDDIEGNDGDDTIINSGTVGEDIQGGKGDDTIEHSGVVEGDIEAGEGDDTVRLTGTQVDGIIDGGTDTDTLDFSMKTKDKKAYHAAKAAIAAGGDGNFNWENGRIAWQNFEILLDNISLLIGHSLKHLDAYLKVIEDENGKLYFYGFKDSANVYLGMLGYDIWSTASAGQTLLNVRNTDISTELIVTGLGNGQIQVQYYSLTDGTLLSATVSTSQF